VIDFNSNAVQIFPDVIPPEGAITQVFLINLGEKTPSNWASVIRLLVEKAGLQTYMIVRNDEKRTILLHVVWSASKKGPGQAKLEKLRQELIIACSP